MSSSRDCSSGRDSLAAAYTFTWRWDDQRIKGATAFRGRQYTKDRDIKFNWWRDIFDLTRFNLQYHQGLVQVDAAVAGCTGMEGGVDIVGAFLKDGSRQTPAAESRQGRGRKMKKGTSSSTTRVAPAPITVWISSMKRIASEAFNS